MNSQLNKKPALRRFPPGDQWVPHDCPEPPPDELKFGSLTDGLEWLYQNYECKKFIVDAEDQIVYMVTDEEKVKKPSDSKYSIYGE